MKIAIKVTKQAAIRAGLDTYGWHTEEIAAADLTPAERNALPRSLPPLGAVAA